MDTTLVNMFNDGDNDGTISIVSADNVEIRCHKWIVQCQSQYFRQAIVSTREIKRQKTEKKSHQKIIRVVLETPAIVIKQAINLLYNSRYELDANLMATAYIDLYYLIDQLLFTYDTVPIKNKICTLFITKLTKDNWLGILQEIYPVKKRFSNIVVSYYMNIITQSDEFIDHDPLCRLPPDSVLRRYLHRLYRIWINKCRNGSFLIKQSSVSADTDLKFYLFEFTKATLADTKVSIFSCASNVRE